MKRTYLYPLVMRRGQPVLLYVELRKGNTFWLCASHMLKPYNGKSANGNITDYQARHASDISEECYDAFVKEAADNARRYKRNGSPL